jgi:hypothetical protein
MEIEEEDDNDEDEYKGLSYYWRKVSEDEKEKDEKKLPLNLDFREEDVNELLDYEMTENVNKTGDVRVSMFLDVEAGEKL